MKKLMMTVLGATLALGTVSFAAQTPATANAGAAKTSAPAATVKPKAKKAAKPAAKHVKHARKAKPAKSAHVKSSEVTPQKTPTTAQKR